jgi:hypothetical protein
MSSSFINLVFLLSFSQAKCHPYDFKMPEPAFSGAYYKEKLFSVLKDFFLKKCDFSEKTKKNLSGSSKFSSAGDIQVGKN